MTTSQLFWVILWGVFLFGGFVIGPLDTERTRRMPVLTRMLSSLVLVLAAWSFAIFADGGVFGVLIAVGMSLGFLGDLFMARLLIHSQSYVLAGMLAFGLGHIAYIGALLSLLGGDLALHWPALIALWAFAVAGWYVIVYRGAQVSSLHYAALPYALLLATTAGVAVGLALQVAWFWVIAVGALLFLLSDLILAAQLFNGLRFYLISDVVWLTYGPGQMLIVIGASSVILMT